MSIRLRLLKSVQVPYSKRVWPVGQVIQKLPQDASELIYNKKAELYTGEYPPKTKMKIELKQLK